MFRIDNTDPHSPIVTSASDLTVASGCEYALLRVLDVRLGRASADDLPDDDVMLQRTAGLGDEHERRRLERYRAEHGAALVEFERPRRPSPQHYRELAEATARALADGAPVVFQGVFYDESDPQLPFLGFADFLVRRPDGRYRVVDTKLARRVKVTALLQLAAYHEQLTRLGVPADDEVSLVLGTDEEVTVPVGDVLPLLGVRRRRLHRIIDEHRRDAGAVEWGDERFHACGRCASCEPAAAAADDLVGVAGLSLAQRRRLRDAGLRTVADLAATPAPPEGCRVPASTYERLHLQARLQHEASGAEPGAAPPFVLVDARPIVALPAPTAGDLFFDFEGDPLYRGELAGRTVWGLDYLFGWVDAAGDFHRLWAHDLDAERRALLKFLAEVERLRRSHPGMHIYHYAAYERTHLASIAARHGVGERLVDDLLRDGVLVDLYPVVRASLRVGAPSYSIKKLEPLYLGSRRDGVTNAADSVVEYARSCDLAAAGLVEEAESVRLAIERYNADDCRSTLALRDWLRRLPDTPAEEAAPAAPLDHDDAGGGFDPSPLDRELVALAERADAAGAAGEADAYRLAAAAIDFHAREHKSFWWEHFARLEQHPDEWEATRGVMVVERATLVEPWREGPRGGAPKRRVRLAGSWAPGSGTPRVGDVHSLYDDPVPFQTAGWRFGERVAVRATVVAVDEPGGSVDVEESCPAGATPWARMPTHLTPGAPPKVPNLKARIDEWGRTVASFAPQWPDDPVSDLMLRRPASVRGALVAVDEPAGVDAVAAVVASLRGRRSGIVAVQGPPGTGKTHLASHVIRRLVADAGWAIGVTAQSHKVIEHVLDGVVDAGLDAALVGKAPQSGVAPGDQTPVSYTPLASGAQRRFAAEHAQTGYVIGGTVWDLSNPRRFDERQLDLLVIDEAGQFSLANTIAAAASARRVLLLGDPQQLPQVSQGIHPAPVDGSALGHLIGGASVLPEWAGYFLPESRRMDAAVTAAVSALSYDGALRSHPSTRERRLEGIAPGVVRHPVRHSGRSVESPEEAAEVVRIVRRHLGRRWTPGRGVAARALRPEDIIVVTPYNAQVECIRQALDDAGCGATPVGTVDRFQGREAVVAVVSLAASDAEEVPRGIEFLLDRNRLNVSISRAKWVAHLVHSPALLEHLPHTPEGVAMLSAFIRLVEDARPAEAGG